MSFAWDITIPATTTTANPIEKTLKLTYGIITKLEAKFAPGCHGLVKIKITRAKLFGILPTNPDEWITGDGETIRYATYLKMDDKPFELVFEGCSPLSSYEHVITVRIEMQPEEVASPYIILRDFVQIFKKLIGA